MGFFDKVKTSLAGTGDQRQGFLDAVDAIAAARGMGTIELTLDTPLATPTDVAIGTDVSTPGRVREWRSDWRLGHVAGSLGPGVPGALSWVWRDGVFRKDASSIPATMYVVVRADLPSASTRLGDRAELKRGGALAGFKDGEVGGRRHASLFPLTTADRGRVAPWVDVNLEGATGAGRSRIRFRRELGEDLPGRVLDGALLDRFGSLATPAQFELCDGVAALRMEPRPWGMTRADLDEAIDVLLAVVARIT